MFPGWFSELFPQKDEVLETTYWVVCGRSMYRVTMVNRASLVMKGELHCILYFPQNIRGRYFPKQKKLGRYI